MSRRKSRILAFQALYSIEVGKISLEDALSFEWREPPDSEKSSTQNRKISKEGDTFARILVSGTVEHLDEIDTLIKEHLKTWDFERVNKVSLSILRLGIYSMLYQSDVQPSIIIDEAIHIAKEFGPEDSFKFINAMLDNIRKYLSNKKSEKLADNEG